MENAHAPSMIRVVVRNQEGIDALDFPSMEGQPLLSLDATDPRIEEQSDAIRLDVNAVAVAAGLERDDSHRSIVPPAARLREVEPHAELPNGWHQIPTGNPSRWTLAETPTTTQPVISEGYKGIRPF